MADFAPELGWQKFGLELLLFLACYIAFFMYEDEEGKWQNRIEKLWVATANQPSTSLLRKRTDVRILMLGIGFSVSFANSYTCLLLIFNIAATSEAVKISNVVYS